MNRYLRALLPLLLSSGTAHATLDCDWDAVNSLLPPNVSLSFVTAMPEDGTFTVPRGDTGWPTDPIDLPNLCAIGATVLGDTANAGFGLGLFLPSQWNGRTLNIGNGGLAGGVNWVDMVRKSPSTESQPGTGVNWGWRALHETVIYGKQITKAFYGTRPSTGGRQGFKEAEAFPRDFDGIIAGAPAWWTQIWQFWVGYVNYISNITMIPTSKFDVIGREVLRQCDGQDGLVDTIISDPLGCNFNPETLLCSSAVTDPTDAECLTAAQLQTFDTLSRDFRATNSTLVFPAWLRGSEHFWTLNIDGGGAEHHRTRIHPIHAGDVIQLSERLDPGQADAAAYNLSAFSHGGGKLLHYHGMSDGGIATGASYYLYEQIDRTPTPQGVHVDNFYRFFPIPGMGSAADYVNAPYYITGISMTTNGKYSVPNFHDAKHDVLLALMEWVENGTALDAVIGTAYANFTTMDAITRQRPICAHPKLAQYQGRGDPDRPENWRCQALGS
ncbi:tannase and feruloyl esterase [Aspergillus brunneoviolaceus CBS 621.78]|uniref:Tannase and feruloyl esterase n=1 Tax=Aspergillus brunneoviolaceus CBS 621.78 TaxID=1450534 RepID=A0ACD1FYX3_9EURO|nr:tannase and feruloyl esterase [Aspergillus brunneoviolaceus CBS 621.78]RAH42152.1 tannase and feruloyl esterase [Aspergillus brunneoviolaceus CBS 621.78]